MNEDIILNISSGYGFLKMSEDGGLYVLCLQGLTIYEELFDKADPASILILWSYRISVLRDFLFNKYCKVKDIDKYEPCPMILWNNKTKDKYFIEIKNII